jgi:signal transduction histidine kinase
MPLENTDRLYLERQVTLARAIFASLSLVAAVETSAAPSRHAAVIFLFIYALAALSVALGERLFSERGYQIPVVFDFLALAILLYLTPSVSAFWFLFLFVVFALATRGETRSIFVLVSVATLGIIFRLAMSGPFQWQSTWHWLTIGLATLVSGFGMGYLGARERKQLMRQRLLEKITGLLHFDHGLAESIRKALGEIALAFQCEQACLAIRDDDLERLFVWKVFPWEAQPHPPETLPLERSETFLIDSLEVSMCWEFANGGEGFGWDRRSGRLFRTVPRPPDSTRTEFKARALLASTMEANGRPSGRLLLINPENPKKRFSHGDLRWLDQIVRHLGPPLENVSLLRNLRARTVEAERSRISRDLHDGILQTMLSLNIRLGVLRDKVREKPEEASADLDSLQKIVKQEGEELRRMVTDMRPVRVESADMKELMFGFAERFQREQDLPVELFVDDRNLRVPDRVCRELFQIYRESLHNVKKHAKASHVVVKLTQDEAKVFLVVDDNGQGFSFSGKYSSEELDRLRLGPISIKERTRGVGGTLTVESNPGHGARLTIEIPFN